MAYGRTYTRRGSQPTGPRANKYDGGCSTCGRLVPAGTGVLTGSRASGYTVRHLERRWIGSPVSGKWVGGCEDAADQPVYEAPKRRRSVAYTSSGAAMYERCTHEDYPCCGC
jgi:hypothetical protein